MTNTEQHPISAPADAAAVAAQIAGRLRTKTIDQVVEVGERTGWWTAELVDWVADGQNGPPPAVLLEHHEQTVVSAAPAPAVAPDEPVAGDVGPEQPAPAAEVDVWISGEKMATLPVSAGQVDVARPDPLPADADELLGRIVAGSTTSERVHATGSAYIAVLQARELGVDHDYQRPLDAPRVKRMAAAWNPRMVGTIDVSDRGVGAGPIRYAVINGQHRAAAAAQASPEGADVWLACTVHEGLTVEQEAALMHHLDRTTKKLSGFDKWRARRGAGEPAVLEVEAVAAAHGLRVGPEPSDGVLRSYGAAEKLLKVGGRDLLDATLAVLSAAYGAAASAYQAPLVTGVGQVLHRNPGLDVARLVSALAGTRPEQLRATATALREADGGPLNELMGRAIAGAYNRTPGAGPRIVGGR